MRDNMNYTSPLNIVHCNFWCPGECCSTLTTSPLVIYWSKKLCYNFKVVCKRQCYVASFYVTAFHCPDYITSGDWSKTHYNPKVVCGSERVNASEFDWYRAHTIVMNVLICHCKIGINCNFWNKVCVCISSGITKGGGGGHLHWTPLPGGH